MVMQDLLSSLTAKDIVEYCIQDNPKMLGSIIAGFMLYNGGDRLKMTTRCLDHETGKTIGEAEIDIKYNDATTF